MKKAVIVTFLALLLGTGLAMAHSGRTDASGCHTDHSTGIYHCH